MKELLNLVPRKARLLVPAIVSLLSIASVAKAATTTTYMGSEMDNMADFGTLGQLNKMVTYANSDPIGPYACVPTATIDGLTYLYNFNKANLPKLFNTPPNTYPQLDALAKAMGTFNKPLATPKTWFLYFNADGQLVLTLPKKATPIMLTRAGLPVDAKPKEVTVTSMGGTYVNSMYSGLASYLSTTAPKVVITGQQYAAAVPTSWYPATGGAIPVGVTPNTIPTANFLAKALKANDGVEIQVQWGFFEKHPNGSYSFVKANGAHELTLDYINFTTTAKLGLPTTGEGTIGYLDPAGSGTAATPSMASLSLINGYLYFRDTNTFITDNGIGELPDGGGDPYGRITSDMVESVQGANGGGGNGGIPDGAPTLLILGASLIGLAAFRKLAHSI
jgi:hypothetical protein